MQVLNWRMLGHPINYIIVILMLVIAGIGGHELLSLLGHEPAAKS